MEIWKYGSIEVLIVGVASSLHPNYNKGKARTLRLLRLVLQYFHSFIFKYFHIKNGEDASPTRITVRAAKLRIQ